MNIRKIALLALILISCAKESSKYEMAIAEIKKINGTPKEASQFKSGEEFLFFVTPNCIDGKQTKNTIDNVLGVVAKSSGLNSHLWESPDYKILFESSFENDSCKLKFWLTDKAPR